MRGARARARAGRADTYVRYRGRSNAAYFHLAAEDMALDVFDSFVMIVEPFFVGQVRCEQLSEIEADAAPRPCCRSGRDKDGEDDC